MEISIQNFVKLNTKFPLLLIILEKSIILTFLTILTFVTPVGRVAYGQRLAKLRTYVARYIRTVPRYR